MSRHVLDCTTDLDWNPLITAAQHSQFSGVVAGLVFTVLAVLIVSHANQDLSSTLQIFIATLFAFAYDSYGFGVISGEQTCGRAYVESVMSGAVLGIGSTGLMTGLARLVNSYGYTGEPLKFVNLVSAAVSAIVALMVMVSAQGYAKAVLYPTAWRDPVTEAIYALIGAATLAGIRAWIKPTPNCHGAVRWATRSSVLFVLISALTAGAAAAFPGKDWATTPSWLVLSVVGLSVLLPSATLVLHARSLPR